MAEYPKWKYHKTEQPKLCEDSAQEEALGKGWFNSPGEGEAGKAKKEEFSVPETVDQEQLAEIKQQVEDLANENVALAAKLQEAEDYIETLEEQLAEAQKNDHRDENGQFTPAEEGGEAPNASDAAIALAEQHGIDITTVTGTGTNGNITKPDVQAVIDAASEVEGTDEAGTEEESEGDQGDEEPEE